MTKLSRLGPSGNDLHWVLGLEIGISHSSELGAVPAPSRRLMWRALKYSDASGAEVTFSPWYRTAEVT